MSTGRLDINANQIGRILGIVMPELEDG